MKKSKIIKLLLLTSLLSACDKEKKKVSAEQDRLHLRSDTTARYTTVHHSHYGGGFLPYYYVFRPFGYYSYGNYHRGGYHSSYVHPSSNNRHANSSSHSRTYASKSSGSVSRGGFGGSSRSSSRGGSGS